MVHKMKIVFRGFRLTLASEDLYSKLITGMAASSLRGICTEIGSRTRENQMAEMVVLKADLRAVLTGKGFNSL